MYKFICLLVLICCSAICFGSGSSLDCTVVKAPKKQHIKASQAKDSSSLVLVKKKKSPKLAGALSMVIPGAGQVYNGRLWKVPIIYGGGYLLYRGVSTYSLGKEFYHGLLILKDLNRSADSIANYVNNFEGKSSVTSLSGEQFKNISQTEMKSYYDSYSSMLQNVYIFSIVLYGLNILDAVVDAHLKSFDVTDELSFKIKPGIVNANGSFGGIGPSIGLQFSLK